jgi:hypothetical protein
LNRAGQKGTVANLAFRAKSATATPVLTKIVILLLPFFVSFELEQ